MECVSSKSISVTFILVPTYISWDEKWTPTLQLSNTIKNWPNIYENIRKFFKVSANDNGVLMPKALSCGSINTTFVRIVNTNEDATAISSSLLEAIKEGPEGLNILSTSMVSERKASEETSKIIGIFVGIGITIFSTNSLI
jgi:hypothetical protein